MIIKNFAATIIVLFIWLRGRFYRSRAIIGGADAHKRFPSCVFVEMNIYPIEQSYESNHSHCPAFHQMRRLIWPCGCSKLWPDTPATIFTFYRMSKRLLKLNTNLFYSCGIFIEINTKFNHLEKWCVFDGRTRHRGKEHTSTVRLLHKIIVKTLTNCGLAWIEV